jgi:hypothetical protein
MHHERQVAVRARTILACAVLAWLALAALPLPLSSQVTRRTVATLPFDSGLIVIDAHSDGSIVVGASTDTNTIATPLPAPAVKEWADSTARLLALRPRSTKAPRAYRATVVNQETGAGITFTRHVTGGQSTYRLFFADSSFGGFPFAVSRHEAQLLVDNLRRAVTVSRTLAAPRSVSAPARKPR